jgi:sphinganine-1-phosphate aldolase
LDVFQSVVRFEAEVVAMTAALLGSKEKTSGGQICGNMTSGGTESILLAVKSSRDYMKSKKGITKPEMYGTNNSVLYLWYIVFFSIYFKINFSIIG